MKTLRKIKKNGSVLALAICILAILLVLGVGFLSLGLNSRIVAIRDASVIVARTAADAGLAEAIFEMTKKLPNIDAISPTNNSLAGFNASNPANYTYQTEQARSYTSAGFTRWYCRAESQGSYNQAARKVVARLILQGLAYRPIQVQETVVLANSTVIGSPGFSDIIIATNSTASNALSMTSSTINGDVLVGVDGVPKDVIKNPGDGTTFNGGQFAATEPYVWIPVTDFMPSSLLNRSSDGNITLGKSATQTLGTPGITTERRYDYIDLDNSAILKIQGKVDLYLKPSNPKSKNALNIGQSAQLQLDPNDSTASLNIYMDGNLTAGNSGPINGIDPTTSTPASADAIRLHIYGLPNCTSIDLTVSGQFYGSIYAQYADIEMKNGFPFVGAIQAKSLTAKNGGTFTFDERLAEVSPFSPGVRFVIDRWWEGAVGETPPDMMP